MVGPVAIEQEIERATALFRRSRCLSDDELFDLLVLEGTQPLIAARLIELLPMVYCRLVLSDKGARFANTFRRVLPGGGLSDERELSSEPIWGAALAYAKHEGERGASEDDLLAIAEHSAEYKAAMGLLQKGSKLEDIAFTSAVLMWPENGPATSIQRQAIKRKGWLFGL